MPLKVLRAARYLGFDVEAIGEVLHIDGTLPPPTWLRVALRQHKQAILALLRPAERGMTQEEWAEFYEERAAILEHDNGFPRREAEIGARRQAESERQQPGFLPPCKSRP